MAEPIRVVMTGGGGFIGSYLLARLVGAGMDVTLIGPHTGKSRYTASLVEKGIVRFLRCDGSFTDEDLLPRILRSADALLLLGYVMPWARALWPDGPTGKRFFLSQTRLHRTLAQL